MKTKSGEDCIYISNIEVADVRHLLLTHSPLEPIARAATQLLLYSERVG